MAWLVLTRTGSKNKNAKDYLRYEPQIYRPHFMCILKLESYDVNTYVYELWTYIFEVF